MSPADVLSSYFGFEEHDTDYTTESLAGLTTFLTMSYIVVVNPLILSVAITPEGVESARVLQMLAVVTIVSSVAAILVMAFYANRPFGLAPGMGLNAFFVTVVLSPGLEVTWQMALAAVFVEGLLFIALTAAGAREYVIRLFPDPVKYGVGAGIGIFLAMIGVQQMRLALPSETDGLTLNPVLASDPVAILAALGVLFTFYLYARGVTGAIIVGILSTSVAAYVASWLGYSAFDGDLPGEGLTLPDATLAPGVGDVTYSLAAYDIRPLAGAFVEGLRDIDPVTFAFVMVTFFFVDFFDTAGTLTGLGQAADMTDEEGNLPEMDRPLMADAVGTTVGGMLGTSTVTTYIESSTGIEEGGRTGFTALAIAALFLAALAFVPLITVLPPFAPYVAFLIVAVFMLRNITDIRWDDVTHAVPASLTIMIMPLTSSIAYGIAAGLISYPIVMAAAGRRDDVHLAQWIMAAAFVAYFVVRTRALI